MNEDFVRDSPETKIIFFFQELDMAAGSVLLISRQLEAHWSEFLFLI